MTEPGSPDDDTTSGRSAATAPPQGVAVSPTARASFDEAAALRPVPDPTVGTGSTDLPLPDALEVVSIADLDDTPSSGDGQKPFAEVLERRRSVRSYSSLDASKLAKLLRMVFVLQGFAPADDGAVRRFRPIPSAGARHPLIPLLLIQDVPSLTPGLWRYDADGNRLLLVAPATRNEGQQEQAWSRVRAAGEFEQRPPAVIVLAAQFDATLARYPSGSTLVWRDAGVALATLQLTATSLDLGSCILGTAGVLDAGLLAAARVTGNLTGDVGCLAVGGAPRE